VKKRYVVIGVIGTHCVGKTTLVERLTELLKNEAKVHAIFEVVRKFPKESLGTLEAQRKIAEELEKELQSAMKEDYELIITDRTFLDVAIYTLYYACTRKWDKEECKAALKLAHECVEKMKVYDLLIYADNLEKLEIVDDGYRLTDWHSRVMVDVLFKSHLSLWKLGTPIVFWSLDNDDSLLLEKIREILRKKKAI
jgi:nicotinamide riboside kinase